MRIINVVGLLTIAVARITSAQGMLLPRACAQIVPAVDPGARTPPTFPVRDCDAQIARTRSDVKVDLVGRVLRYEVDERFINNGGRLGEADYLFPMPAGAAFQELRLSVNGELVTGETMNANEARRIYEEIVRKQRDPALV